MGQSSGRSEWEIFCPTSTYSLVPTHLLQYARMILYPDQQGRIQGFCLGSNLSPPLLSLPLFLPSFPSPSLPPLPSIPFLSLSSPNQVGVWEPCMLPCGVPSGVPAGRKRILTTTFCSLEFVAHISFVFVWRKKFPTLLGGSTSKPTLKYGRTDQTVKFNKSVIVSK